MSGVSVWNTGWEATPLQSSAAGGPSSDSGPNQLINSKVGLRSRLSVEMNFGDSSVSGTSTDTGRMRQGSAIPFYQTSVPTAIAQADQTGSTALANVSGDSGRCWIDLSTNGSLSRRRLMAYDYGTAGFVEVGANCGLIQQPLYASGYTALFFTAATWTDVFGGSTITVVTPTNFNGEQYTLVIKGLVTVQNNAGAQQGYVAITNGAVSGNTTNVAEAAFPLTAATSTESQYVEYQISTGRGTLVQNTTYTFHLSAYFSLGAARGIASGVSKTNGENWLRAYLFNASEA